MWTPENRWVLGTVGVGAALVALAVAVGLDPFRLSTDTFSGAVCVGGSALAALGIQRLFGITRPPFGRYMVVAGIGVGMFFNQFLQLVLERHVGTQVVFQFLVGAATGALCGLIPKAIAAKNRPNLAAGSFWACVATGSVGGLLFALPVTLVLAGMAAVWGRDRSHPVARA